VRKALRPPWWAAVFLLALALRLGFVLGVAEPLLYSHPYNYFHGGLSIVEHERPLDFVLRSDRWHLWLGPWTIAPLYYLFVAAVMALFGPHLLPLLLIQCVMDALVAVMVGLLGRSVTPRWGAWAGVAYALNAHAIELCGTTLTENLHTPLLVASFCALLAGGRRRDLRWTALGGLLLGVSALARSVSTGFVPLAALWRAWRPGERPRLDLRGGAVVAAAAACAILPWTARNVFLIGDLVPVESNAVYNFWDDNSFAEGARRQRQEEAIAAQPTPAAQRAQALTFALRGIARHPDRFVEKAWLNLLHFVRPDGLHLLLRVEDAQPPWRHAALVLLTDTILLGTVGLLIVFAIAGRSAPARTLLLGWTGYYLLMVVVLFHNEIRYRSTLMPFAIACAAGGAAALADPEQRRRTRTRLAAALAVVAVAFMLRPYPVRAWRALVTTRTMAAARAALERGDAAGADVLAWRAASQDREAARPWLLYGRALARARAWEGALAAFERAAQRKSHHWTPIVVRPRLLRELGRAEEAAAAGEAANRFSFDVDPWWAQEVAWRELPPPIADEVLPGRGDYGAVRGFSLPHRDHRWTLGEARVRLQPTVSAFAYDVTLDLGSPEPSPHAAPRVKVWIEGGPTAEWMLSRQVAPYTLRVPAPREGTLVVCLRAPTWNHTGEPAEQGVRLDRLRVTPAASAN
jgi:4-amino-4-deoxy-L-arabinose transferase-like glycosyltransferase